MNKNQAKKEIESAFEEAETISHFKDSVLRIIDSMTDNVVININSVYENMVVIPVVEEYDKKLNIKQLEIMRDDITSVIEDTIKNYRNE